MHFLGDRLLGVLILFLLGILVGVKRLATGSVLDERPDARFLVQVVNAFNLAFLLVVNPLAAVLLVAGRLQASEQGPVAFILLAVCPVGHCI